MVQTKFSWATYNYSMPCQMYNHTLYMSIRCHYDQSIMQSFWNFINTIEFTSYLFYLLNVLRPPFCTLSWLKWVDEDDEEDEVARRH